MTPDADLQIYEIIQSTSDAHLGYWVASSEEDALQQMLRAARAEDVDVDEGLVVRIADWSLDDLPIAPDLHRSGVSYGTLHQ